MADTKKAEPTNEEELVEQPVAEGELVEEPVAAEESAETEASAEEQSPDDSDEVAEKLAAANARADENWDKLVRMQAEMDNLRKRNAREIENAHKFALDKIAAELLGVRDSLENGIKAGLAEDADVAKLREGNELILKQLTQAMEKFNIVEVNPEGDKFNPDLHQAMSMQDVPDTEPNTVIGVMQKGYTLNDRLLRPALVMVSK